jgi:hypothetical protein
MALSPPRFRLLPDARVHEIKRAAEGPDATCVEALCGGQTEWWARYRRARPAANSEIVANAMMALP